MNLGFQLITQMKRKVGNTYPLRYARPPTLGGQPHPVACGPSEEFSAFRPSGRRCSPLRGTASSGCLRSIRRVLCVRTLRMGCSPKVGELPERVRGMNRPKRAYGMKLPRMLIPPPLRSSSYLRRTAPSGCLLPFGLLSAFEQARGGRIKN